jgi:hypothetical protein
LNVIAGLDPAIHPFAKRMDPLAKRMDPRVKPAGDGPNVEATSTPANRKFRPNLAVDGKFL